MNRSVWRRVGIAAALPLALTATHQVHAEPLDPDASLSLKLAKALRERAFMRAGVISIDVKTSASDTRDVTGNVVSKGEINAATFTPAVIAAVPSSGVRGQIRTAGNALDGAMDALGIDGIGTPSGIKARADDNMVTPGLSIGYYLTDDFTWLVEAYVLAAPLKSKIYGAGINGTGGPNGLSGKHIISTKLLPPTVLFGRYWGDKTAKFRPYTGLMGTYAIFFDTEATSALNGYVGGDTSISLKNAFGVGPSLGFKYQVNDDWHVSLNLGTLKLKTQATITTRSTVFTSDSAVLNDYPQQVLEAIQTARSLPGAYFPNNGGAVTVIMREVARARNGSTTGDLGTYVRKQDTTLTNTVLMFSVGRTF